MNAWNVDIRMYIGKVYYIINRKILEDFIGDKDKLTKENACWWVLKHYIKKKNSYYSGNIVSIKITPR